MRFTLLLSALTLLSSVLGNPPKTRTERAQPVSPHYNSHFERQVVGLNGCVSLQVGTLTADVTIPGLASLVGLLLSNEVATVSIVTTERLCLCAAGGVITDDSVARLRTALANQLNLQITVTLLSLVRATVAVPVNLDLTLLARLFGTSLLAGLGTNPTPAVQCVFNPGAIPNSCTACTYDCPTNLPIKCDRGCRNTACPSGLSTTDRRRSRGLNGDFLCPAGLTVCGMANHAGNLRKVECLDTQSNVEACGGCEFPLNGQVKGSDCTAISHTDRVACVAGQCVVESCRRGFTLIGGECVLPLLKQTRALP